jgi:hypothetical protein
MKTFLLMVAAMMCTVGCSSVSYVREKVPGDVLSIHKTEATYEGTQKQPCRFMTADCPDRCNHGGTIAIFKIEKYTDYKLVGKYGDEKQENFMVPLLDGQGQPTKEATAGLVDVIKDLTPGTKVELHWTHTYVDDGFVVEPRRLVTRLTF